MQKFLSDENKETKKNPIIVCMKRVIKLNVRLSQMKNPPGYALQHLMEMIYQLVFFWYSKKGKENFADIPSTAEYYRDDLGRNVTVSKHDLSLRKKENIRKKLKLSLL